MVLVLGGLDPSGGAGLAADIEALGGLGCHPAPVATAITVQDTIGVSRFAAIDAELVVAQARSVFEDLPVAAVKTGMLASPETVVAVAALLRAYPDVPVIVDPVLGSGRGDALAVSPLQEALCALLVPRALLLTPNSNEARSLTPAADTLEACAQELLSLGSEFVLVTGTHETTPQVINRLYGNRRLLESFSWPRLPHDYHGSGCTLASACAAGIAHGASVLTAVAQAQKFTWEALRHGHALGRGQRLPDRYFWSAPPDAGD